MLVSVFALVAIFALMKGRQFSKRVFSAFLCLAVFVTGIFNLHVYVGSVQTDDASYRAAVDLEGRIENDGFYRVKSQNKYFVVNLLGSLSYPSLSHYTSLTDSDYMFAMKKLGYSSYWMEVNSNGGTLLTDAILKNDYTVSRGSSFAFSSDVVYQNDSYSIIKSAFTLPAAAVLKADPRQYELLPDMERSELQQYLYTLYGGEGELITKYDVTSFVNVDHSYSGGLYRMYISENTSVGTLIYSFYVEKAQSLYFDAFKDISNRLKEALNDSFSVTVNGRIADFLLSVSIDYACLSQSREN